MAAREERKAAEQASQPERSEPKPKPKRTPRERKGPSKNALRAQRALEREIEAAEAALRALEEELADPGAWSDPERSAAASERHTQARREVEELLARWEAVAG